MTTDRSSHRTPGLFTLAWPADLRRYGRGQDPPRLLVFRRHADERITVDAFPDEADVCEEAVAWLDPELVRLERGRLYIHAANGDAVYVPVGPSPLPHCTRYGRLYLREKV